MKNIIKTAGGALAILAMVDAFGFIAWVASGQTPADGFYIGALTASVLRALIF